MKFEDHKPIYLQISDTICEKIINNEYAEDDRIASVREMGALLGVNPNTIMRSYDYLKSIEVIYDKRGVGFFIAPKAKRIVKKIYKEDFIEKEIPTLIKKMKLLDIEIDDLKKRLEDSWEEE